MSSQRFWGGVTHRTAGSVRTAPYGPPVTITEQRARTVLRVDAVLKVALGVLLVLDTWDGAYQRLDLPQALPALLAQIGGVVFVSRGYLLWRAAAGTVELRRAAATTGVMANAGSAAIIAAWLIFRGKIDLEVGTQGIVELIVAAVVLGLVALADAAAMRSARA
jgi:hypothetical protein